MSRPLERLALGFFVLAVFSTVSAVRAAFFLPPRPKHQTLERHLLEARIHAGIANAGAHDLRGDHGARDRVYEIVGEQRAHYARACN